MIINKELLDSISLQAKSNERLRMNYNFHSSPDSKAQCLLNALEIGTIVPIHRHIHTGETYLILRGKIRVLFYDERGFNTELFMLDPNSGNYGVHIPQGTWHTLEVCEEGSVILEVKEGPYTPITEDNMLR